MQYDQRRQPRHGRPFQARGDGSSHTLPFEKLAPLDFERLCLWLVTREGYSGAEHLGAAGSESGRDVVAWKDGRRVVFQSKRVRTFTTKDARAEIKKLRGLPEEEQPHELVFVLRYGLRRGNVAHNPQRVRDLAEEILSLHSTDRFELLPRVVTPELELRLLVESLQKKVGAADPRAITRDINRTVREVRSRRRSTSTLQAR